VCLAHTLALWLLVTLVSRGCWFVAGQGGTSLWWVASLTSTTSTGEHLTVAHRSAPHGCTPRPGCNLVEVFYRQTPPRQPGEGVGGFTVSQRTQGVLDWCILALEGTALLLQQGGRFGEAHLVRTHTGRNSSGVTAQARHGDELLRLHRGPDQRLPGWDCRHGHDHRQPRHLDDPLPRDPPHPFPT